MTKKSKAVEDQPKRPDVPTKNGHYMGLHLGFEYEDGKYKIAPRLSEDMEQLIAEENGLRRFMQAQDHYFSAQFRRISDAQARWWESVMLEYGIKNVSFSYEDGWLIPIPKYELPYTCVFCEVQNIRGLEALKQHRLICEKDPLALRIKELEQQIKAISR